MFTSRSWWIRGQWVIGADCAYHSIRASRESCSVIPWLRQRGNSELQLHDSTTPMMPLASEQAPDCLCLPTFDTTAANCRARRPRRTSLPEPTRWSWLETRARPPVEHSRRRNAPIRPAVGIWRSSVTAVAFYGLALPWKCLSSAQRHLYCNSFNSHWFTC